MKTTTYTALETVQKEFCNHTLSAESSRDWVGERGGEYWDSDRVPPLRNLKMMMS